MSIKNQFIKNRVNNVTNDKKELNHKIAVIFLSVLMIFWTVASIASVYLVCDKFLPKQDTITASADEVLDYYVFDGSNFFMATAKLNKDQVNSYDWYGFNVFPNSAFYTNYATTFFNFRLRIINNNGSYSFVPLFSTSDSIFNTIYDGSNYYTINGNSTFDNLPELPVFVNTDPNIDLITSPVGSVFYFFPTGSSNNFYSGSFFCAVDQGFTYPISVTIGSYSSDYDSFGLKYIYTYYFYTDPQNNSFVFQTMLKTGSYFSLYNFNRRTYYFNAGLSDTETYDLGYNDGYNIATSNYNDSLNNIQDQAYQRGYNVGDSAGYSRGYAKGTEDAGNYTFLSLLGSVIDAPVQAITGLFNFEFLGINMLDFFFGVLTLMLVIFVVRLCLGG